MSNGNCSVYNILVVPYPAQRSFTLLTHSSAFSKTLKNQTSGAIYLHTSLFYAPHTPAALLDSPNFNLGPPGGISVSCPVCPFLRCNLESFSSQRAGVIMGLTCLYFFTPGSQSCAICSSMSKQSSFINYTQFPSCLWQEDESSISYSLWLNFKVSLEFVKISFFHSSYW